MKRERIIELAKQADLIPYLVSTDGIYMKLVDHFAALIEAETIERCAAASELEEQNAALLVAAEECGFCSI